MFIPFSHFLSYGSTDQQTIRSVSDCFQGMIVPGTIAAFQADGTRGFVLSLSAATSVPYAIDPRTPLFQTFIESPKKSHGSLAMVLGLQDEFARDSYIPPAVWTPDRIQEVAERWLEFNTAYLTIQPKAFDKYARRLGRPVVQEQAQGPEWILPPYLTRSANLTRFAEISNELWRESVRAATDPRTAARLRPVVAVDDPRILRDEALSLDRDEVVVWVSDLDEVSLANEVSLGHYARAVRDISDAGVAPFALYGGYFAVALGSLGLTGASHGVGFSEHRSHIELKSSGAAPARYYVERLHRYVPVDLASELWRRRPDLVESFYTGFDGVDPQELDYHDLMQHSVRARWHEIEQVRAYAPADHVTDLRDVHASAVADLEAIRLTEGLRRRANSMLIHLPMWARALEGL